VDCGRCRLRRATAPHVNNRDGVRPLQPVGPRGYQGARLQLSSAVARFSS
jgi:hypothetical protein